MAKEKKALTKPVSIFQRLRQLPVIVLVIGFCGLCVISSNILVRFDFVPDSTERAMTAIVENPPTATALPMNTAIPSATYTITPSGTATLTATSTLTPTITLSPTITTTSVPSQTPTVILTYSPTPTATSMRDLIGQEVAVFTILIEVFDPPVSYEVVSEVSSHFCAQGYCNLGQKYPVGTIVQVTGLACPMSSGERPWYRVNENALFGSLQERYISPSWSIFVQPDFHFHFSGNRIGPTEDRINTLNLSFGARKSLN